MKYYETHDQKILGWHAEMSARTETMRHNIDVKWESIIREVEVASDRDVPRLGVHGLLKATDTKLSEDEQLGQ
jgi:hypothetical protein